MGLQGFLYGLGDEGIPTDNMLAPLKPQGTGQKAPDGLQHPNGDASEDRPSVHTRTAARKFKFTCRIFISSGRMKIWESTIILAK